MCQKKNICILVWLLFYCCLCQNKYYSFKIIIIRGMGGDLGVEKGGIELSAPTTPRAPPPGHWRVFARRHHQTFQFLRRAQNARYFVRLNGAVAPASRRAKTHVFACRHYKIFKCLGRRPQNALYVVRLNGAVAPASQCAKTHV